MIVNKYSRAVLCASIAIASISIERTGWLDRVVQYHKNSFYNEILSLAPIQIEATIERAPEGYVDSPLWDVYSVIRLLTLISESESCVTTRYTLRRMLRPTRRIMMSKHKSYKMFPSLNKKLDNYLYYDMDSDADYKDNSKEEFSGVPDDDAVIVVGNPVEARLPSAQISVKLLREILEARALAGRVMPPTTKTPIPWKPMNTTAGVTTIASSSSEKNTTEVSEKEEGKDGTGTSDPPTAGTKNEPAPTTSPAAAP